MDPSALREQVPTSTRGGRTSTLNTPGLRVSYDIGTLERIVGRLPRAADRLVIKWARLHREATPNVLEARPTEECRIWLCWEDGLAAEVDFSYLLDYDGVWLPLRDPEFFRRVAIYPGGISIYWPGEVDICPDKLYGLTREAAGAPSRRAPSAFPLHCVAAHLRPPAWQCL